MRGEAQTRGPASAQLGEDRAAVELVPGLGEEAVGDAQDRGRGELDRAAGGGDAEELAAVGAAPALVGGDEVVLGEDQRDFVLEIGKGREEVVDGLALAGAAARLAVVDEIGAEQPLAGGRVALDDRFPVEAPDQLLVLREADRGSLSALPRGTFTASAA